MQPNAFLGKTKPPSPEDLAAALGSSALVWEQIVGDLAREHDVNVQEWKSVSPKYGWSLRLKLKKRTIVYLSPHSGAFTAIFILGDKAVDAAREDQIPPAVIKQIIEARRYAEGTGVRIEVKSAKDMNTVKKLAKIKLEN
jgi:hypothetical protein